MVRARAIHRSRRARRRISPGAAAGEPERSMTNRLGGHVPPRLRARALYLALAAGTIALGLAVHRYGDVLSPAVRDVLGDALWAVMVVLWVGAAAPAVRLWRRAAIALASCFAVELSQLYHTPALDALRRTPAGQLTLGSGFDPRDVVAYAAGVLAAALLEETISRHGA